MKIPYIKIPIADISAYLAPFSFEEKGKIFQAVLDFGLYQEWADLELSERGKVGYSNVQEIVENEIKSYKKFCKEQKQKIKNHWAKIKNSDDTTVLPARNNQTETETKQDINNISKKEKKEIKKFQKPSVLEIKEYCTSRNNGIDAQAFFDFYESKGWKVGNTPMKNWQAAVNTWERRQGKEGQNGTDYNKQPDVDKYANFGRRISNE